MTDTPRGPTTEQLRARALAQHQLDWMDEMERIEQEVFPDARPRSEVTVEVPTTTERGAPMRYCVNATLTVPAYLYVDADSPEAALEAAREARAQDFESDMGSAEVEFNVTPAAEVVTA